MINRLFLRYQVSSAFCSIFACLSASGCGDAPGSGRSASTGASSPDAGDSAPLEPEGGRDAGVSFSSGSEGGSGAPRDLDGGTVFDGGSVIEPAAECRGGNELTFYAAIYGGGALEPGSQVVHDNGNYLLVQGNCRYWVFLVSSGHAISGVLTQTQRDALAESLNLDDFSESAGNYEVQVFDGPTKIFWYDGARIVVRPGPENRTHSYVTNLQERVIELLRTFERNDGVWSGRRVEEAVRFMLVEEDLSVLPDSAKELNYRAAPAWPLAEPPERYALKVPDAQTLGRGDSQRASGAAGAALRNLWTRFEQGEIGFKDTGFVPIEQQDGTLYRLRLRDSIPLEDERGILPLAWP